MNIEACFKCFKYMSLLELHFCICLYFYCILLLLFYKDEWKLKKNANNTNDKKCRGHRFKSIETKVELISQSKSRKFLASS